MLATSGITLKFTNQVLEAMEWMATQYNTCRTASDQPIDRIYSYVLILLLWGHRTAIFITTVHQTDWR